MTLLDNDRQVHPLMNHTIDVIGSRCGKWSDLNAIAIDLYIIDERLAWYFLSLIGNHRVIMKNQRLSLLNNIGLTLIALILIIGAVLLFYGLATGAH